MSGVDQRTLKGVAASLSWLALTGDGRRDTTVTDGVTVSVTRDNGTELVADAAATTSAGLSTYTLAATHTQLLDVLTATWSVDGDEVAATTVEVVAGYYASHSDLAALPQVAARGEAPDVIAATRMAAEQEIEDLFEVAFVPRYARERIYVRSATDTLILGNLELRTVRSATVEYSSTSTESLTADECAAIEASPAGLAVRTDGGTWPSGTWVEIIYEHGYDRPPGLVLEAFHRLFEAKLQSPSNYIGGFVETFIPPDGGSVRMSAEDRTFARALKRYGRQRGAFA